MGPRLLPPGLRVGTVVGSKEGSDQEAAVAMRSSASRQRSRIASRASLQAAFPAERGWRSSRAQLQERELKRGRRRPVRPAARSSAGARRASRPALACHAASVGCCWHLKLLVRPRGVEDLQPLRLAASGRLTGRTPRRSGPESARSSRPPVHRVSYETSASGESHRRLRRPSGAANAGDSEEPVLHGRASCPAQSRATQGRMPRRMTPGTGGSASAACRTLHLCGSSDTRRNGPGGRSRAASRAQS
jgi:hypothetical protein